MLQGNIITNNTDLEDALKSTTIHSIAIILPVNATSEQPITGILTNLARHSELPSNSASTSNVRFTRQATERTFGHHIQTSL